MRRIITMGIISTILNFFGCSTSSDSESKLQSKEFKEQLAKSIEDFKNRRVHSVMTEQIIDNTSNDSLLQVIFDNLSVSGSPDRSEYETVTLWNKSKQAIYIVWLLEAEVNNGGFNQFYSNSSGEFYKLVPQTLRLLGANKFADLTERANRTYENEHEIIVKYQDGTIEGFSKSYDNNPLNKYDDEFYQLYQSEDLQKLQVDYIRRHKIEFVD